MMSIQSIINWILSLFKTRKSAAAVKIPQMKSHVKTPLVMGSPKVPQPYISMGGDWRRYATQPFDNQWLGSFDSDACVTESGIHVVEQLLNYLYKNRQFPVQEMYDLIEKYYLNPQGFIELSVRFNAAMNGTTEQGLAMDEFWLCLNRDGFVPKKLWPDPNGFFNRETYYARPSQEIIDLGKTAAKIFQFAWQVIVNNDWNAPDLALLKEALNHSPLQFASAACSHDAEGIERWCHVDQYKHARVLECVDEYLEILDSEFTPGTSALKKMETIFPLACIIKSGLVYN